MKRASYREAVRWIADNDDVDADDQPDGNLEGIISIALVADIFDVPTARVVTDVLREKARTAAPGG